MELQQFTTGGVYLLADHYNYDKNRSLERNSDADRNGHFYYCIGSSEDTPRSYSYAQALMVTSMRNCEINCELPICIHKTVSYIVPYSIYHFTTSELENNCKGVLGDSNYSVEDFITGIMYIYQDKVVFKGNNKEIHDAAVSFHDNYVKNFYSENKGIVLYGNKNEVYRPVDYYGNIIAPIESDENKPEIINGIDMSIEGTNEELKSMKGEDKTAVNKIVVSIPATKKAFSYSDLSGAYIKKLSVQELQDLLKFLYSKDPQVKSNKKQVYKFRNIAKKELEKRGVLPKY